MYLPWYLHFNKRERFWRRALELALASVLALETGCGTCTYHGKLVGARDCEQMKKLGMPVEQMTTSPCTIDNCGKEPR